MGEYGMRETVADYIVSKSLADFTAASTAYVSGLDRSVLGRFGSSFEVLVAEDSIERINVAVRCGATIGEFDFSTMERYNLASPDTRPEERAAALLEVHYWWAVTSEKEHGIGAYYTDDFSLGRLRTIATHPDMHDYFAADIWDVDFIEHCIADGIDGSLAASVSAAEVSR